MHRSLAPYWLLQIGLLVHRFFIDFNSTDVLILLYSVVTAPRSDVTCQLSCMHYKELRMANASRSALELPAHVTFLNSDADAFNFPLPPPPSSPHPCCSMIDPFLLSPWQPSSPTCRPLFRRLPNHPRASADASKHKNPIICSPCSSRCLQSLASRALAWTTSV